MDSDQTCEALNSKMEPEAIARFPYADDRLFTASIAVSLKRIADSFNNAGSEQGSVLWWLENLASAANAERM